MTETISKTLALKEFFGTPERPVTNGELIELRKEDPEAYDWMGIAAAKALGKEVTKS